ncbi:hypothetical protein [Edaphobacter modestus]|uniref:Lipocalin-like protein n=1 Tax=Edaphobacter modestus TaxID=388466 RepID=A0A4Q7Y1J1_9BACT|nr:hypothetical protein [Edaphobacter modestus]RZU29625.1 hypothetical protein BDD14_6219 [Edaphobacter modestus]
MRNSKAVYGMHLVPVFALAVMLLLTTGLGAQEGNSESQAGRLEGIWRVQADRLEGMWRVQLTVRDCQTGAAQRTFPALFAFAKGGILTYTTAGQPPAVATPGYGIWGHTGGHNYSAVTEAFIFNPAGSWIQTHRLTRTIELNKGGDDFTDTTQLEIFDSSGNLIVTGCATSVGRRF